MKTVFTRLVICSFLAAPLVASQERAHRTQPDASSEEAAEDLSSFLDHYVEMLASPSPDAAICGDFELVDPRKVRWKDGMPSGPTISLQQARYIVANAGYQEKPLARDLNKQRNVFDDRCYASILLEKDQLCDLNDLQCAVVASCEHFARSGRDEEARASFEGCIDSKLPGLARERQRTLAATIDVEGEPIRFYLGKRFGEDDRIGNWCGETLFGRIQYPNEFRVTPGLARTVSDILQNELSDACPAAQYVDVELVRYKQSLGPRAATPPMNYLHAYKDNAAWAVTFQDDFIQKLRSRATFDALEEFFTGPRAVSSLARMSFRMSEAASDAALNRYATYAREGKVCEMRDAVRRCQVVTTYTSGYGGAVGRTMIMTTNASSYSTCEVPCKGVDGYCNMETGASYASAGAAEQANCRSASQAEIDRAIAQAQPADDIPAYDYQAQFTPWSRLREDSF